MTTRSASSADQMMEMFKELLKLNQENQQQMFGQLLNAQSASKSSNPVNVTLPTYHGRPDENLETWAFTVQTQLEVRGVDDAAKVAVASGFLRDAALQWFYNHQNAAKQKGASATGIRTWSELIQGLRVAFQPADYQNLLRDRLRQLQQRGSSTLDYVTEFRNLNGQILNSAERGQNRTVCARIKTKNKSRSKVQTSYFA